MDFFGMMAFMLCLYYGDKLAKMERKVKKMQVREKGDDTMSRLLQSLTNQKVKLVVDEWFQADETWTILEVDEDWVKVQQTNKKGKVTTKILRVDDIKRIELLEEA